MTVALTLYIQETNCWEKRGRGTEKTKVFVGLSLNEEGKPEHLTMQVTNNLKQASVKKFAENHIEIGSEIHADEFKSYPPALEDKYKLETQTYDPSATELHWLHTIIGNAKAFIQGTYHGRPKENLQDYLDEFCFRFSRRYFHGKLFERLAIAAARSVAV